MASGGARNRSGPTVSETSARSDRRGYVLTALPADGYRGPVPDWPLECPSERELEVWAEVWCYPQAEAWSQEPWRTRTVAMWVRVEVRCEDPDCPSSLLAQRHRLGDQIGLTTAGLAENGWKIAAAVTAKAARKPAAPKARRRLRAVDSASA